MDLNVKWPTSVVVDLPSGSSNGRPWTAAVDEAGIRGSGPHYR
jgi:hypothetical protein